MNKSASIAYLVREHLPPNGMGQPEETVHHKAVFTTRRRARDWAKARCASYTIDTVEVDPRTGRDAKP